MSYSNQKKFRMVELFNFFLKLILGNSLIFIFQDLGIQ